MMGIQVRWPLRPWNRASPSNPVTRKYSIEMVVDMHTEVRRTLGCSWEVVDTTWRCTASLQCGCPYHLNDVFPDRWIKKGRPYSTACEIIWPESPPLFTMGMSKVACIWDPSWKGHRIICQNCSCLWYYSKLIRDICQGAAESCTPMSVMVCFTRVTFFFLRWICIDRRFR